MNFFFSIWNTLALDIEDMRWEWIYTNPKLNILKLVSLTLFLNKQNTDTILMYIYDFVSPLKNPVKILDYVYQLTLVF